MYTYNYLADTKKDNNKKLNTMIKNITIVIFALIICAMQYDKMENLKDDSITIYTPNDILYILPNSNTIETERGENIYFSDRKTLSEYISNQTSEVVNMATLTNFENAKQFIQKEIEDYDLATDEEINEAILKSQSIYPLNQNEIELIEKFFYI